MEPRKSSNGNFVSKKTDWNTVTLTDFDNPWTFYGLFLKDDNLVFKWLRKEDLLAESITCSKCQGLCQLSKRTSKRGGYTFRCNRNKSHEYSMFKYSFFDRGHTDVRDVMQFIKSYLDGMTLKMCSTQAGINYSNTGVKWASYIREIFVDYFSRVISSTKISGEIEIDESLFGRKWKHHRGKNRGAKVWIFGMVERLSNTLILYPVDTRDEESLVGIIKKHVEKGSRIYSDGWSGYLNLNEHGYEHFSVIHKTSFKQTYKNDETGETVVCHTNQIEGAWKHAKAHFKRINGTSLDNFESHLCEVMWRSYRKGGCIYNKFFQDLKTIYTLMDEPQYHYKFPIFDTWDKSKQGNLNATIVPESQVDIDTQSDGTSSCQSQTEGEDNTTLVEVESTVSARRKSVKTKNKDKTPESLGACGGPNDEPVINIRSSGESTSAPLLRKKLPRQAKTDRKNTDMSSDDDFVRGPVFRFRGTKETTDKPNKAKPTETPKSGYSSKLSFLGGFKPVGEQHKIIRNPNQNPYTKDNFVEISSDDEI